MRTTPYAALEGHTAEIWSVCFSLDGKTLASGGDQTVRLWDTATGQHLKTLTTHHSVFNVMRDVRSVCFSPNGNILAIAGSEGVQFWDVTTNMKPSFNFALNGEYYATFNRDGNILACWDCFLSDEIFLWDVPNRQLLKTLKHCGITSISFSPTESKYKMPFVPDKSGNIYGSTLASGSDDGTVHLWNIDTGDILQTFTGHLENSNVCFSPDGSVLADIGSDNTTIRLWNIHTGQPLKILNTGYEAPWCCSLAFSPDRGTLASVVMNEGGTHNIQLWNIFTGKCRKILKGNNESIRSIAFSPDGRTLASGNEDGSIKLWKISIPIWIRLLGLTQFPFLE